jgi:hypothetical protein
MVHPANKLAILTEIAGIAGIGEDRIIGRSGHRVIGSSELWLFHAALSDDPMTR